MIRHGSERNEAVTSSAVPTALRFRAMTFNILCRTSSPEDWPARRQAAVKLIRHHDPDLLAVQECMPEQLHDLRADLGEYDVIPGPLSGPSHLPHWAGAALPALALAGAGAWWNARQRRRPVLSRRVGAGLGIAALALLPSVIRWVTCKEAHEEGEHCALFFRREAWRPLEHGAFWLSPRPDRPNSVAPGSWLPRVVNWARLRPLSESPDVTLFNVHSDYLPVVWPTSAAVLEERLARQWDGSLQILLGDFNAVLDQTPFSRLLEPPDGAGAVPGMRDAYAEAHEDPGPDETLHDGCGNGKWPGRLDHVLFRGGGEVKVERLITVDEHHGPLYPSDHFPLVADFVVGGPVRNTRT